MCFFCHPHPTLIQTFLEPEYLGSFTDSGLLECESESVNRSVVSDSLQPHGLYSASLLCPWNSPGKATGVGCHFLLQGIFLTQGLSPTFMHWRWILDHLSHLGSPPWKAKTMFCPSPYPQHTAQCLIHSRHSIFIY